MLGLPDLGIPSLRFLNRGGSVPGPRILGSTAMNLPLQYVDVAIAAAAVLTLNATPVTLVAAPGAGFTLVFDLALVHKPAGTAYAGVAAGEDLAIKYTDASGLEVGEVETTGFVDQTTAQTRVIRPHTAASLVSSFTPVANAPLVAHMLTGEITTGDSPLRFRVFYRVLPTVLS